MMHLVLAAVVGQSVPAGTTQDRYPRHLLEQPSFYPVFDMYSRGRAALVVAGNRLCAATANDKPRLIGEMQTLKARLDVVATRLKQFHPNALNLKPTVMYGPPQLLCDDEKAAREAVGALESVVIAAEYLAKD